MKHTFLILVCVATLSGCGPMRNFKMDESNAAYKACLAANPKKLSACEVERLSYEADQQAVLATKAGLFGIGSTAAQYKAPICNAWVDSAGHAQSMCQ